MSGEGNRMEDGGRGDGVVIELEARPERRLIRPGGSRRHIAFRLQVSERREGGDENHTPLVLALVLDRSGSMAGEKLITAKRTALAMVNRLDERDRVAVVVFDDRIDTLQALAPAMPDIKAHVRAALSRIEARASTALHEGWLTGCQAIAVDRTSSEARGLARCFLLTDGRANVGITDPEQIASQAAGIREHAMVGTSTLGVGPDYDELLLAPMAVAGGGQFHHLRDAGDIAKALDGEQADLFAVAAKQVRLGLEFGPDVQVETISAYWVTPANGPGVYSTGRCSLSIGDLVGGEERRVVVRFGFPPSRGEVAQTVRARVAWVEGGDERHTDWEEVRFAYASHQECDVEAFDQAVMHWVGLHHAERAKCEATEKSRRGDLSAARDKLRQVRHRITKYAGEDTDLLRIVRELSELEYEIRERPLSSMSSKEALFQSQRLSRGQKDYR